MGQGSIIGIATYYELDGLGIEAWWCKIFCTHPDWPWGTPSLLYSGYWDAFPGVEHLVCGVDHPPI
jgi:hypothetical protein